MLPPGAREASPTTFVYRGHSSMPQCLDVIFIRLTAEAQGTQREEGMSHEGCAMSEEGSVGHGNLPV